MSSSAGDPTRFAGVSSSCIAAVGWSRGGDRRPCAAEMRLQSPGRGAAAALHRATRNLGTGLSDELPDKVGGTRRGGSSGTAASIGAVLSPRNFLSARATSAAASCRLRSNDDDRSVDFGSICTEASTGTRCSSPGRRHFQPRDSMGSGCRVPDAAFRTNIRILPDAARRARSASPLTWRRRPDTEPEPRFIADGGRPMARKRYSRPNDMQESEKEPEEDRDGRQPECLMFIERGAGDGEFSEFRPLLSAERRRNSPRPNQSESVLPEGQEVKQVAQGSVGATAGDARAAGVSSVRLEAQPIQTNRRCFSFYELQADAGGSGTCGSASEYLSNGLLYDPLDSALDKGEDWLFRGASPRGQRKRGSFDQLYEVPSETEVTGGGASHTLAVASAGDVAPALESGPLKRFSWHAVGGKLNLETVSTAAPSPAGYSPRDSPTNSPRMSDKEHHTILFHSVEAISTRGSRENADGDALRSGPRPRRDSLSEVVQRRDHAIRKARTASQTRWR